MEAFDILEQSWSNIEAEFMASAPMRRLEGRQLTLPHYAAYLRETYFYTREDPQIQAACTTYFRGTDRALVKLFLHHAISEVGHDQLALDDLRLLGFDTTRISSEYPLPNTTALISFPFYAMQYRSTYSYLGYLYFLEFIPTSRGAGIIGSLKEMGVPDGALTFLQEHNAVDVQHNKLMRRYANEMLRDIAARDEVAYSMQVTSTLFANMLEGAFTSVDEGRHRLVSIRDREQKSA